MHQEGGLGPQFSFREGCSSAGISSCHGEKPPAGRARVSLASTVLCCCLHAADFFILFMGPLQTSCERGSDLEGLASSAGCPFHLQGQGGSEGPSLPPQSRLPQLTTNATRMKSRFALDGPLQLNKFPAATLGYADFLI